MKWNHLPEGGGLYRQNPTLLDRFYYIFAEKARHEAAEAAKKNRESGPAAGRGTSRSAVGGRRRR
jgi:hypothetical protein